MVLCVHVCAPVCVLTSHKHLPLKFSFTFIGSISKQSNPNLLDPSKLINLTSEIVLLHSQRKAKAHVNKIITRFWYFNSCTFIVEIPNSMHLLLVNYVIITNIP